MKYPCWLMLLLALALAADLGADQGADPGADFEAGLSEARGMAESGHPEVAAMLLEELAARAGAHYEVRLLQGIVQAQLGETPSARQIFGELLAIHPERPELYNNLAALAARDGDLATAIEHLERGVTHQQPAYLAALENLKRLYAVELGRGDGVAAEKPPELAFLDAAARPLARAVDASDNGLIRVAQPIALETSETVAPPPPMAVAVAMPVDLEAPAVEPPEPAPETPVQVASIAPETDREPSPELAAELQSDDLIDVQREIRLMVDGWAKAWSAQQVDDYLDFYADDFRPADGSSRVGWAELRSARLAAPSTIRVWITALAITVQDAERARARFTQHYESDTYSDVVTKLLELRREADGWRILEERVEP